MERHEQGRMELWIWRHLRLELPAGWEMLQVSQRREAGRCAFADRYQFRLELGWRVVPGPPDLDRMMSDYAAKLAATAEGAEPQRLRVASWPGLAAAEGGLATTRFGGYLPGERCVVEAVFLWPEGRRDEALERRVLDTLGEEPPREDGSRRWRAFGLDLVASAGLGLAECHVEPARARLAFAEARKPRREVFERLGLVDHWLDRPLAQWLEERVPRRGRISTEACQEVAGHEVVVAAGRQPVRRLGGLVSRACSFESAAWRCPGDGRLYAASFTGAPALDGRPYPWQRLACCGAMAAQDGR